MNFDNHCQTASSSIVNGHIANMSEETETQKLGKNAKRKLKIKMMKEQQTLNNFGEASGFCANQQVVNGLQKTLRPKNVTNSPTVNNAHRNNGPNNLNKKMSALNLNKSQSSPKKSSNEDDEPLFSAYWSERVVNMGLADKKLISGVLRINKNNYRTAYVTHPDGGTDIVIEGVLARNRALEGDVVIVSQLPMKELQRFGEVVYIRSEEHPRTCIGSIQNFNKNHKYLLFVPRDYKFPRLRIYRTDWPNCLLEREIKDLDKILYYGKLTEWTTPKYGIGAILKEVGKSGEIEVETKSILLENGLDGTPHGPEFNKYFPNPPFVIPETEKQKRLDYRDKCVFTIDPLTARDLDDALSCEELPNGNFKIGVHISDVAYFLKPGTDLDKAVANKAISIYLVESVYHMLPKTLCLMCSLLPGQDRLAFSVFWEMTPEAEIVNSSFEKTIINSCTQLAYEHAQKMIDTNLTTDLNKDDFPEILHGYNVQQINRIVNQLQKLATILRDKRFAKGALRIDQAKLCFRLNPVTCMPESFSVYEMMESNRLIEEFMLLANITVATYLFDNLPKTAFLRAHPEPQMRMLKELEDNMKAVGVILNVESSKSIQCSLKELEAKLISIDSAEAMMVINNLCSRAMTRAHYFCVSRMEQDEDLWHYALSVERYTHFTSPIRRYADIIVHRQLAHVMGIEEYKSQDNALDAIAAQCNRNKFNAKRAGEMSSDLYLSHYIVRNAPLVELAIICDIKDRSLDIIVISMNLNKRIYFESVTHAKCEPVFTNESKKKVSGLIVNWQSDVNQEELISEYMKNLEHKSCKTPKNNKNGGSAKKTSHEPVTPNQSDKLNQAITKLKFDEMQISKSTGEEISTNLDSPLSESVNKFKLNTMGMSGNECNMTHENFTQLQNLRLFSKVRVVLCGFTKDPRTIEAFLLPY